MLVQPSIVQPVPCGIKAFAFHVLNTFHRDRPSTIVWQAKRRNAVFERGSSFRRERKKERERDDQSSVRSTGEGWRYQALFPREYSNRLRGGTLDPRRRDARGATVRNRKTRARSRGEGKQVGVEMESAGSLGFKGFPRVPDPNGSFEASSPDFRTRVVY